MAAEQEEYLAVLKASYDYEPQSTDEIEIKENQILFLIERVDEELVHTAARQLPVLNSVPAGGKSRSKLILKRKTPLLDSFLLPMLSRYVESYSFMCRILRTWTGGTHFRCQSSL